MTFAVGQEYLQFNEFGAILLFFLAIMYEYYRTKQFGIRFWKSTAISGLMIFVSVFLIDFNYGNYNVGFSIAFILVFMSFGALNFFFSPLISLFNIASICMIVANSGTYTLGCYDFLNVLDFINIEGLIPGYLVLGLSTGVSLTNSISYFSDRDIEQLAGEVFQNLKG